MPDREDHFKRSSGIQPGKTFVVYVGEECYPVSEGVEAISMTEMAQMLLEKRGV